MNATKIRDRDLFPERKWQQGASDALSQVRSQQRGHAKIADTRQNGTNLSFEKMENKKLGWENTY